MVPEFVDVLLVGGGVASVRCARTLRRERFDGRIVLVGDEPMAPYNRPPLSKELLRDDVPDELLLAEPERWYDRRSVELRLGDRVVALDVERRTASLDDGSTIGFATALLATGATPRTPPIEGGGDALLLRTFADARRIRARAVAGGSAVIIGGGLIGVEVASALATLGMRVTLLELTDRLWAGGLGERLAEWGRAELDGIGIDVRLATAAHAIEAEGIRIGSEVVPADLVVAGVGVTPNDGLARAAGLATDDGILADLRHATSAPGIFTAGDVARVDGRRVEHWHAAREGGERAALAMLGRPVPPAPPAWVFTEIAGHAIDIVGAMEPHADERWVADGVLACLEGSRLIGAAILDGAMPVEEARAAVARGDAATLLQGIPPG